MSGPKSSRYTLSAEQLRRIREEQDRIKKELEEKAKKDRECKEAQAILNGIVKNTARHVADVRDLNSQVQVLASAFRNIIDASFSRFYVEAEVLTTLASKGITNHSELMATRTNAEHLFSELIRLKNKLVVDIHDLQSQQAVQDTAAIAGAVNVSFKNVGLVMKEVDQTAIEALEMLHLLSEQVLPNSLHDDINTAVKYIQKLEDHALIENYVSITVASIRKQVKSYQAFRETYGQQFDRLLDQYHGLCMRFGVVPREYASTQNGLSELQHDVYQLEYQMNHDAKQTYISQSLDEVMREMGYHVIGHRHVTKKSGKTFTNELLTYEDGTMICVTKNSTGQITMEIGGTDEKDRAPNANERVALRKKMEQFCRDFKEIEKRLSDRGVVLDSRLSMAPPEEIYAQIINLSDFEIVKEYRHYIDKHQAEVSKAQQKSKRNE